MLPVDLKRAYLERLASAAVRMSIFDPKLATSNLRAKLKKVFVLFPKRALVLLPGGTTR